MKRYFLICVSCTIVCVNAALSNPNAVFPKIKGWKLIIEETLYNASTLWEYINGAAEIYLAYDFQNLYLAKYTNKNGQEIRIEIYEHSSPVNAFGIYTAERMSDYNFVNIGVQGYAEPGLLNFYTGKYYIKLISSGAQIGDKVALMSIATEIDKAFGFTKNWPKITYCFPAEGKIPNTENFIAKNFLGYSFFHSAFTAEYDSDEKFQIFIIELINETEVMNMLNSYIGILNEDKIEQENDFYKIEDFFNGTIFLRIQSNYIMGVTNTANRVLAKQFLTKIKL
jgi:hypothetical protein